MRSRDPIEETRTPEETAASRAELERKTTEELFAAALVGEYEDDIPWEAVSVLRLRGTPEVFQVAKRYCESENPKARSRGLNVLAQLGAGKPEAERPFTAESVSIAIDHLREADPDIVSSAAWALSHLGTRPGVAALIGLRSHPTPVVRQAVACCFDLRSHPEWVSILSLAYGRRKCGGSGLGDIRAGIRTDRRRRSVALSRLAGNPDRIT
jgi:HEAT repeat protein